MVIKKEIFILSVFLLIGAVTSFLVYRHPDFDFYSYHYYNGWAFLNNRINIDLLPCAFRTYFNPILDSFTFIIMYKLNNFPSIFIMISGLKYGILMYLAYKLYFFIFQKCENKYIPITFCLFIAGLSPVILFCTNYDNNDLQCAILILLGFYIYLKNIFNTNQNNNIPKLFIATIFIGMAIGLKYSLFSSGISLILTSLCFLKKYKNKFAIIFTSFAGLFCGVMITGAYWMYILYKEFGNPLFPYFNNFFKSNMADQISVLKDDFDHLLPKNIFDFIFYPLKNSVNTGFVGMEKTYFDLKISLGFITTIMIFVLIKIKKNIKLLPKNLKIRTLLFILYFTIFSYYINLLFFANIRYIIPLFIIIPIIIYTCIYACVKKNFVPAFLIGLFIIFLSTFYSCRNLILYNNWNFPTKIIEVENLNFEDNSIIICGNIASCYIAPSQNPNVKYLGFSSTEQLIQKGYWHRVEGYKNFYYENHYLEQEIIKVLTQHKYNIYFLYSGQTSRANNDLKLYDIAIKRYSKGSLSLKNCKKVNISLMGEFWQSNNFQVCKLYSKKNDKGLTSSRK